MVKFLNKLHELWHRDSGMCHLCDQPVELDSDSFMFRPTKDHIIPVSDGGSNKIENLKIAHQYCNVVCGSREITTELKDEIKLKIKHNKFQFKNPTFSELLEWDQLDNMPGFEDWVNA